MFLYAIPDQTEIYSQACTMNTSKSEDYRRHCKKYSLTLSMLNAKIDLPPELDVHPLPTLGTLMTLLAVAVLLNVVVKFFSKNLH